MFTMSNTSSSIEDFRLSLEKEAYALGFSTFGISRAEISASTQKRLCRWLEEGMHGDMLWMRDRLEHRLDPQNLWPDVRSVIMLGMNYAPTKNPLALADDAGIGRISVYAQGRDYHDTIKKALKHLARWLVQKADCNVKVFVDTAPVMEKSLAVSAGLGWQGKHSNVISRQYGNWLFLGAIYTTLDLEPNRPAKGGCGSCSRCQIACPTNAFPREGVVDARRCISYLIEYKGIIPQEFRRALGNHIYGCDDCLASCPWNKFAHPETSHPAFWPRAELAAPELRDLLTLKDSDFRQFFSASPIKRIGRDRFIRNCLIAAGNSRQSSLLKQVMPLLEDPAAIVRAMAIWALRQLDIQIFRALAKTAAPQENDVTVQREWQEV
ncbi:tRNA epoxyqueuosine(34) reductase QueG [Zymomonas mobilis]|uniref:tRNA epoxyqueuosine(34) reductase QueG n=1 Tax=Zymomonas mobilis TaxID=542 RepID=UPI0039ED2D4B